MRGACASRPGMSLLEVAIALAMLVMIAAMVMPSIGPRLDRRVGIEARSRIQIAIGRAQADASLAGEPARVLAVGHDPQQLVSESLAAVEPDETAPAATSARTFLAEMPAGCHIRSAQPAPEPSEPEMFGAPRAESSSDTPVLVGWVLPDGTFIHAGDVLLSAPRGDESLALDAWTARVAGASTGEDAG